jgi:tRNA(Met) cytidine acetyltransferase
LREGRVVAASLVAREGGLPLDLCARLARGEERIRGHALADTLISHAGIEAAGALTIARSVRIAVHPALRRQGIARRLVEEIHARRTPDLFGTLFGATPDLLRFRRSLGYVLVRLGVSRGARTGEPSAIMVRPVSPAAHAIVRVLREELARGLDRQLELLRAEGELALDPELAAELRVDLPQMSPPTATEIRAAVDRYLAGPRPYDGVAWAIERFVEEHRACASELDARARALVEARVVEGRSWSESARSAGFLTVPAAMRALRPAIAAFVDAASTPTRD